MVQRGQNAFGSFVKLIEYGTKLGEGIIVVPEGKKGSWLGWFCKESEDVD